VRLTFTRIALALVLALGLTTCGPSSSSDANHSNPSANTPSDQTTFDNPGDAQQHCPNDTVVWVNTRSGIYHMPGQRWYGNTEEGDYMCQQDADSAGDRETRNGQ
jgi:hypothetical protein